MISILLIEDMDEFRADLTEIFEIDGYLVFQAANGQSGVDIAQVEIPDIIICDATTPESNAVNVIEKLRQDKRTASIPVIMLGGNNEDAYLREHALTDDNFTYLLNPLDFDDLYIAIQIMLQPDDS